MPSKSKTKGSTFERWVAEQLNDLYQTTEFCRVPGSGSFMGRSNFQKKEGLKDAARETLTSDIMTPSNFKFTVECKHYADAPKYHHLLDGPSSELDVWLSEVELDASNLKKMPMLIFKTTRKGAYVAIPRSSCTNLNLIEYYSVYRNYIIMSFENFKKIEQENNNVAAIIS